ncbi:MAG: hypothetical protein HC860_13815 [Alkalinema sp. RU_4_3]|nr:hypothetical protein [Alkalinema sp. RU_4_3]
MEPDFLGIEVYGFLTGGDRPWPVFQGKVGFGLAVVEPGGLIVEGDRLFDGDQGVAGVAFADLGVGEGFVDPGIARVELFGLFEVLDGARQLPCRT